MERSKGDTTDLYALNIISHTGTHIDAPLHFIPNGATIDTMPIEALMGPARIIEIQDPVSVKTEELKPEDKVVGGCDGGTMKIVYVRK